MSSLQSPAARRLTQLFATRPSKGYANGGPVRGPGTGTSDSIKKAVPPGTFVMPADSTKALGKGELDKLGSVPVRLSNGEYEMPPEQVHSVGVQALMALMQGTHKPVKGGQHAKGFADGGVVDDERQRSNSYGDAAAASADRSVTQVPTSDAQSAVSQIPTDGYSKAPEADGSQSNPVNTELGRNVANSLAAIPGVGGVGQVASTGGAISSGINAASRMLNVGAGIAASGLGPSTADAEVVAEPNAGRGTINPPAADPSASLPSAPEPDRTTTAGVVGSTTSNVNREGSSYSADGPVTGDITINGKAPTNGGVISDQNMAAADALSARQRLESVGAVRGGDGRPSPVGMTVEQAQPEGLVGAQVGYNPAYDQRLTGGRSSGGGGPGSGPVEPGSFTGGFSGSVGGGMSGNMMTRTPDQQRRDAEVQSTSILKSTADRGRAALQGFEALDQQASRNAGDLNVANAREAGATSRVRIQEAGENNRFGQTQGLARDRFGIEQTTAGYSNRAAQRIENLMAGYDKAPADQRAGIAEQIRVASGKDRPAQWKAVALQGSTDAQGNKTQGVLGAVNEHTGEFRQMDKPQAQAANTPPVEGTRIRGKDGRLYLVKNGKPVLAGG